MAAHAGGMIPEHQGSLRRCRRDFMEFRIFSRSGLSMGNLARFLEIACSIRALAMAHASMDVHSMILQICLRQNAASARSSAEATRSQHWAMPARNGRRDSTGMSSSRPRCKPCSYNNLEICGSSFSKCPFASVKSACCTMLGGALAIFQFGEQWLPLFYRFSRLRLGEEPDALQTVICAEPSVARTHVSHFLQ